MTVRPDLAFISPRFLLPLDSGGRIRTCHVLKGLKEQGGYRITLVSPASGEELERYREDLEAYCDEFVSWSAPGGLARRVGRARGLLSALPMPVFSDNSPGARAAVEQVLAKRPNLVVFDFIHSAVLRPPRLDVPSVMFTHNVEAEIFERHVQVAANPFTKLIWRQQFAKMQRFERASLAAFDAVVAVSERDSSQFGSRYGLEGCYVIPTSVDLEYLSYREPAPTAEVAFCGSMDWLANQDGVEWLLREVWPSIQRRVPAATARIIGRNPPDWLVQRASAHASWSFTGFVDDVRPHLRSAAVSIIPLRVGGGTRLKAYESMALGVPIVSTSVGVEGLDLNPGEHYLRADGPSEFADAVVNLLEDRARGLAMSQSARRFVEDRASYQLAAKSFRRACDAALDRRECA